MILARLWRRLCDFLYDTKCALYHKCVKPDPNKPLRMQTQRRKDFTFYIILMSIPVIQFCIMWIGVNVNHILLAFKEYDPQMNYTWTLDNFKTVITNLQTDMEVQQSLGNSILFYLVTTVISVPTSLFISFYFYKKWKWADKLKLILFVPSMISGVVTVTCFYYLADRGWPMLMEWLTGKPDTLGLLVDNNTRLPVLMGYNIFYSLAGSFLFYSSAMSNIDNAISEASQLDGCNIFQEFIHITLPMIFPLLSTFIVAGLAGMMIGDHGMYAFSKTGGGAVPTMGYYFTLYVTQDGAERRFPYFAALGLVLTVMTCVVVFSVRALLNRYDPFEEKPAKKRWGK